MLMSCFQSALHALCGLRIHPLRFTVNLVDTGISVACYVTLVLALAAATPVSQSDSASSFASSLSHEMIRHPSFDLHVVCFDYVST